MAFPDELLVGSEQVIERFRPSWTDYLVAEVLRLVTFVSVLCVLGVAAHERWVNDETLAGVVAILLLVGGVVLVLSAIARALRWQST